GQCQGGRSALVLWTRPTRLRDNRVLGWEPCQRGRTPPPRGVVMWERLRQPGGTLGRLSLACSVTLAAVGVIGAIALLVSLATGSGFWSDTTSDKVGGLVFFVLTAAGAVGFYLMDRSPWGGAALAVIGG